VYLRRQKMIAIFERNSVDGLISRRFRELEISGPTLVRIELDPKVELTSIEFEVGERHSQDARMRWVDG